MNEEKLAILLGECIADIVNGLRTVEQCLADHPESRASLAPELRMAARIHHLPLSPDPGRKALAREDFMAAIGYEGISLPDDGRGAPEVATDMIGPSHQDMLHDVQPWHLVDAAEGPTPDVRLAESLPFERQGW